MKTINRHTSSFTLALLVLSTGALADTELPHARELVDRHIEAVGGAAAMEAQLESTVTGRFGMPAAGLEGSLMIASRPPASRVMKVELPGIGMIHTGYTDGQAWSVDPFLGPRLLEGKELAAQKEANEPGGMMRSDEFVESMTTTELAEYNDQACYKVEIQWRSGRESSDCYSVDTGLLIASESTEESPMGVMEMTSLFSDYENFGDVQLPKTTQVMVMGQEQRIEIDSVEFETPSAEHFELPAAIETLLEDQESE